MWTLGGRHSRSAAGNSGIYPTYLCNRLRREGLAQRDCLSFRCDLLDQLSPKRPWKGLSRPAQLELAVAALEERCP